MKIITEGNVEEYFLDKINKAYVGFTDNTEVELKYILSYDLDLDNIESSSIELESTLYNKELENHFKGYKKNCICYIRLEATGIIPETGENIKVWYEIPCEMKIRRLRKNGDIRELSNMYVIFEGLVK